MVDYRIGLCFHVPQTQPQANKEKQDPTEDANSVPPPWNNASMTR